MVAPQRILLLGTENADGTVTGVSALGASQPVFLPLFGIASVYLRSVGTTSGGTVLIEEADWGPLESTYTGTWSVVATISASAFSGGVQQAYHIANSAYRYVRVRISSAITGGGTILASIASQGGGA
jgi:hypothetical protein